jgi:hypothetical protein
MGGAAELAPVNAGLNVEFVDVAGVVADEDEVAAEGQAHRRGVHVAQIRVLFESAKTFASTLCAHDHRRKVT